MLLLFGQSVAKKCNCSFFLKLIFMYISSSWRSNVLSLQDFPSYYRTSTQCSHVVTPQKPDHPAVFCYTDCILCRASLWQHQVILQIIRYIRGKFTSLCVVINKGFTAAIFCWYRVCSVVPFTILFSFAVLCRNFSHCHGNWTTRDNQWGAILTRK